MKSDKTTPNVPTLRFAEFAGEWQDTTLGNVCVYRKTRRTAEKKNYISTENILQNYQGVERFTSNESISGDGFNKNDILMGNIRPYLKKVYYADFDGVCNADVLVFKSNFINPHFLYCRLANDTFINYVMKSVKGSKMPRGDKSHIMQYPLSIPGEAEQSKISNFIELLTSRIQVQNKIIEDLKVLKKELCKVILNNKGWPKFRIRDIANLGRGRVINTDEINSQHSPLYPVYSSQTSNNGIMGYLDQYDFEGEYITWTTDGANAGTVFYRNGRFNCTNVCGTLKLTVDFDYYITALSIQMVTEKYVSKNLANPKLMNNVMAEIEIFMPDFQTQKSLSSLFMSLDKKIESAGELLSCFVSEKKFLLNAMFI